MKTCRIISFIGLITICQLATGQQAVVNWEKWKYLMGEWVGEGTGQPGENQGSFSFQTDLDGKILVRKNHTAFPATANSPAKVHDDLLIVYQSFPGGQMEAIYFDNEGNTIRYKVSYKENSIVFTSNATSDVPGFRLSYIPVDNKAVSIIFEIASPKDPEAFKPYLSGKAIKVK